MTSRYPSNLLGIFIGVNLVNSCEISILYDLMYKNSSELFLTPPEIPFEADYHEPPS